MPYPSRLLNDYETVAVDLHPHWWYFAQPVAALIGSMFLGVLAKIFADDAGTLRVAVVYFVIALIVASMAWVVVRYLKWTTTSFVITSDRLVFRTGVVSKMGVEIPLERINTIHFSQKVFERLTGSGDLIIESGGEDGQQRFTDIRRPDQMQKAIHAQKEAHNRRRFAVSNGDVGSINVAGQLEKLEGMLKRGTLTAEEFQWQKDKLFGH
ncbi:MAG: PH domain-containing protein [Ilumatobacter sp.]|nr:PH domain-containing protein [Ilumatobacter sp.]